MRFFLMACMFCLVIASVGCMTKNWSAPLFRGSGLVDESSIDESMINNSLDEPEKTKPKFWTSKFGESSGLDPRAQAIEKRFGL